jgi:TIR domain-containing protein
MAGQSSVGDMKDDCVHDLFVSYATPDREIVRRYVERFRRAGLRVWWDREIYEGRWDAEIETALNSARRILVFISKNAVESSYVFVEAKRGRDGNKVIPIRIDNAPLKFAFDGLLALVQHWFLDDLVDWESDPRLLRLIALCSSRPHLDSFEAQSDDPLVQARIWLDSVNDVDRIADALAVAVLESEACATVLAAAEPLRDDLRNRNSPDKPIALSIERITRGRDKMVKEIGAEIFRTQASRVKMAIECIRFCDERRAHALLYLAWESLDELRKPLMIWLNGLASRGDVDTRYRVAIAVGVLAQQSFPSVFDDLIRNWALSDKDAERQTADLALSIAALAPEVADAIGTVLIKDWSSENATVPQLRAAVELACGSTGFRLAPQAMSVLKRIAQRDHKKLLTDARKAVTRLVATACTSEGDDLFDLTSFLAALADWAEKPGDRDVPSYVPTYLFLSALSKLPVSDTNGGPSLARLFDKRERIRPAEGARTVTVLEACGRAFKTALSRREDRKFAEDVLREWSESQKEMPFSPDPILALARSIFRLTTPHSRDRQRIEFIFRNFYSARLLASDDNTKEDSP